MKYCVDISQEPNYIPLWGWQECSRYTKPINVGNPQLNMSPVLPGLEPEKSTPSKSPVSKNELYRYFDIHEPNYGKPGISLLNLWNPDPQNRDLNNIPSYQRLLQAKVEGKLSVDELIEYEKSVDSLGDIFALKKVGISPKQVQQWIGVIPIHYGDMRPYTNYIIALEKGGINVSKFTEYQEAFNTWKYNLDLDDIGTIIWCYQNGISSKSIKAVSTRLYGDIDLIIEEILNLKKFNISLSEYEKWTQLNSNYFKEKERIDTQVIYNCIQNDLSFEDVKKLFESKISIDNFKLWHKLEFNVDSAVKWFSKKYSPYKADLWRNVIGDNPELANELTQKNYTPELIQDILDDDSTINLLELPSNDYIPTLGLFNFYNPFHESIETEFINHKYTTKKEVDKFLNSINSKFSYYPLDIYSLYYIIKYFNITSPGKDKFLKKVFCKKNEKIIKPFLKMLNKISFEINNMPINDRSDSTLAQKFKNRLKMLKVNNIKYPTFRKMKKNANFYSTDQNIENLLSWIKESTINV